MFIPFQDLRQNIQINGARSNSKRNQEDINALNWKVEKLQMITEALWRILQKTQQLEDSELEKIVDEIDLEDGLLDGKVAMTPAIICQKCSRAMSTKLKHCIYCGATSNGNLFKR